ncbi:MAG: energy transducer TonB [Flavobacteriaceae bacterium]|jgi:protein TonB|nr:energy transducer TonB [Flavobacteriaceae bacterium]
MADNQWQSLEDMVFEHKNKNYGAYRLRSNERGYLTKAFFIGTIIFVLFVLLLYFYNRWQVTRGEKDRAVNIELIEIQAPEEEEIFVEKDEPPPPPPPEQEEVAQVKMVMPEPKKSVVVEETIPPKEETENKVIGLENKEGRATNDAALSHGKNDAPPAPPVPPPPDNKIFNVVDQDAEFKGGEVSKYIARYIEYTDRALDNGTEGKILVRFIVEKDGTVTGIDVVGKKLGDGLDEIAKNAIRKTSKMWIPGKVNNQPVRSYFRVPITFRLPQ